MLRNRLNNSKTLIGVGQLCFVFGAAGQFLAFPPGNFWQGLVYGLSTVLIGISIVFNIRGMVLYRQQQG